MMLLIITDNGFHGNNNMVARTVMCYGSNPCRFTVWWLVKIHTVIKLSSKRGKVFLLLLLFVFLFLKFNFSKQAMIMKNENLSVINRVLKRPCGLVYIEAENIWWIWSYLLACILSVGNLNYISIFIGFHAC